MHDYLRLLLTGAAVSAVAIVLAVWVHAPAEVRQEDGATPSPSGATGPDEPAAFVSPVKDGVWPSAVVSEDMRQALEKRAAAEPAATGTLEPSGGLQAPREIGEFMDPDAPFAVSSAQAPRSIGDFLDAEAVHFERGTGERVSIGRFLDPERPRQVAAGAARPVSIGRPIDPDGATPGSPAAQFERVEIGEYVEVDAP